MVFLLFLIPFFSFTLEEKLLTLPDAYLDQVMQRKKPLILECANKFEIQAKDLFIEISIQPSGKTKARLINSEQKNEDVMRCSLSILNRIQFKKFSGSLIVKNYYFKF